MRFLRGLLIIGIILIYASVSWPEDTGPSLTVKEIISLSLNEALQIALVNNFDVQLNLYDRDINQTDIDKAESIYDTVLTLTGEYTYDRNEQATTIFGTSSHTGQAGVKLEKRLISGTELTVDFQNTRESTDSPFSTLNPSYESWLEMSFTQPLLRNFFGMQNWGNVRITKIDADNFDSETLDKVEENLADVEKAYWDAALAIRVVEVGKEMYQRAEEFYNINKRKKELGTSELTDLLAAEANMKTRKTELAVEENKLKTSINKLKLLINYPGKNGGILPVDAVNIADIKIDFLYSLKKAFEKRRDYKRAKSRIKTKRIKFNMKRNAKWPQLDLEGSLKLNGVERMYKDAAADAFVHENPEYFTKATFSFPFENRKARGEYNEAKLEKAKALLNLKKVEKAILTEIEDKVRNVNLSKSKAQERMEIEKLQKRKLDEAERQFEYGRWDSDKIIRFQEDLLQAKILTLKALKDYKDSLIDLYLRENTFLERRGLMVR